MKALSLLQPWATLVVLGYKRIETRSWATDYRGPLLIHASRSKAGWAALPVLQLPGAFPEFKDLPFGAIIGEASLRDVVRCTLLASNAADWEAAMLEGNAFGSYMQKYCWLLDDAVAFEEIIPAVGRLGLWEF
jgi:hypothetical protein